MNETLNSLFPAYVAFRSAFELWKTDATVENFKALQVMHQNLPSHEVQKQMLNSGLSPALKYCKMRCEKCGDITYTMNMRVILDIPDIVLPTLCYDFKCQGKQECLDYTDRPDFTVDNFEALSLFEKERVGKIHLPGIRIPEGELVQERTLVLKPLERRPTLWMRFKAFYRLDLYLVCQLSMGVNDYHDYPDDSHGRPLHFSPLTCKRCGKRFNI